MTEPIDPPRRSIGSHRIWQVNLANRLDPDGTTRDYIDRRLAQAFGYPERRRDDKAEPDHSDERQHTDG